MTIMLSEIPAACSSSTAETNDNAIAARAIRAALQLPISRPSATATKTVEKIAALLRLRVARSMKLAG
jgi:hypothetical protein